MLERDSGAAVARVLTEHYGATDARPSGASLDVGVDRSDEPRITVWIRGGDERDLERAVLLARTVDRMVLPAGAEAITVRHADAREIARRLGALEESESTRKHPRGCALPKRFDSFTVPEVDSRSLEEWKEAGFREVEKEERLRYVIELRAEWLREILESEKDGAPGSEFDAPPSSFEPWNECALVVLEAHRHDDYFARVREYVASLDVRAGDG